MTDTAVVAGVDVDITPEDDNSLPVGYELVEDESVEESDGPVTLEGIAVLEGRENWVGGEEMLRRAIESGNRAGLRSAKALLRQQHLIPVELRGKVLVFTGTVVRRRRGFRCVACLFWFGGRWHLLWLWLAYYFRSACRSVRCSRK